jgi:hypothetical protein
VIFFIGSTNLYLGLPDGKYIMPICAKGSALYIQTKGMYINESDHRKNHKYETQK